MATLDFDNMELQNDPDNKYLELCKAGRILEAVKAYRDDMGCGLAEAKAYIDNLRSKHGIEPQSSGNGCMGIISILIIVSFLSILYGAMT